MRGPSIPPRRAYILGLCGKTADHFEHFGLQQVFDLLVNLVFIEGVGRALHSKKNVGLRRRFLYPSFDKETGGDAPPVMPCLYEGKALCGLLIDNVAQRLGLVEMSLQRGHHLGRPGF